MRAKLLSLCLAAALLAPTTIHAKGPFGSIRVGNWNGGAFANDATGQFTGCIATASYANGILLTVMVDAQGGWKLGFGNNNWHLQQGQTFPIDLTFDAQGQFHVFGVVITPQMVAVPMPATSTLIGQFRKSKAMTAFAQGQLFPFNLDSTSQLLPTLTNCVVQINAHGLESAGDFSAPPPSVPAPKQTVARTTEQPTGPTASKMPKQKVVQVSGTGFLVSSEGYVVTNEHVIGSCVDDISGSLTGESPTKLRLVSSDAVNDLAVLKADVAFKHSVEIRGAPIRPGDPIIVIGFPFRDILSSEFSVTTGIISSLGGVGNDSRYFQISAPVQPGNSGGPLLDAGGHVVGVVAEKLDAIKVARLTGSIPENVNFAIKTGALRDFLDKTSTNYQVAAQSPEIKTAEVADAARGYVLHISCSARIKE